MNFSQQYPNHRPWIRNHGCAVISTLYQINKLFDIDKFGLTIEDWFVLFKRHELFTKNGLLIWNRLKRIFPVEIKHHLWGEDRSTHLPVSKIGKHAVVSVDMRMATEEYDSTHFVAVNGFSLDDIMIYDCYFDELTTVTNRYDKGSTAESVYSIINIGKDINDTGNER